MILFKNLEETMNHSLRPLPPKDPISGKNLIVTEVQTADGEVTIRAPFEIPRLAQLDPEHYRFMETFLRCRGMMNAVERELGISYPTVRAKLDSLLQALDLQPVRPPDKPNNEVKSKIIEQLERGEISADEAKERMREVNK